VSGLLRLAARAYPRAERALVLALAEELVDGGASPTREAAGIVRASLEARIGPIGALQEIELPLAGFLLAAMALGALEGGLGWSWGLAGAGALAALIGFATGRRALALPGAAAVAALCALDGYRDLYGGGSRWMAMFVDVLPALLPPALLLLAAATRPRRHGLRATAWTLAATAALILTALAIEANTTSGTTVLAAGFGLAAFALLRHRTAAPLVLAAVAPAGAWSITAGAPSPAFASFVLVVATLVLCAASVSRRRRSQTGRENGTRAL
jgi:hypothetical protein